MKLAALLSVAALWATSLTAKDLPRRFPAPKGGITAVYQSSHGEPGRLSFVDHRGREIYANDYTKSVYTPGPGQWTASGRFFVYPLISRDGDPLFSKDRFDIVDVQDRRFFVSSDLFNEGATTSEFELSKQDTITFYEVDDRNKNRRKRRSVSLSRQVPSIGGESTWNAPSDKELEPYYNVAFKAQKSGICNIHKVHMEKKLVPIAWGLISTSIGPLPSTSIRFFPHARMYVNGGCEVDPARQNKKVSIYVCAECRRAEWHWAKSHPQDPWSKDLLKHRY